MLAIVLVLLVAAAAKLEAVEIDCEKKDRYKMFAKCCYLNETTVINSSNVSMGGLEMADLTGFFLNNNKKIQFLPVDVYKKFPNLEFYSASEAGIKEISALNFKRLSSLMFLDLSRNQIEFIPDECFHGLFRLSKLRLSKQS